ncbi:MAG: hypothetical protein AB7F98_01975 [Novosphingobium sp.]
MTRIAINALAYSAAIFALGFVLGALRTVLLVPRIGALGAVLAELPLTLAASWLCARQVLRRRPLSGRGAALAMGALAFALLIGAELALGVALFGQSAGQWLAALGTVPGLAGLAGQVLFALMPAWAMEPRR